MDLMREESFGPVIGIQKVSGDAEALALMNDTRYGLTAGVFTKDEARARALLAKVNAGSVYWNCCDRVSPRLPWSGHGDSGVGLTLSTLGIQTFTRPARLAPAPARVMPRLALFDLDHTLLTGDSDVLWCEFLMDQGVLDRAEFEPRNDDMARRYREGSVSAEDFCDFYVATLAGRTLAEWRPWRERFLNEIVAPRIPASARALVESHRARGDRLVMTTATNRVLTELTAQHLRHRRPARDRGRGRRRPLHRPHAGRAEHARRQGHAAARLAERARPGARMRWPMPRSTATRATTCRCCRRSAAPSSSTRMRDCASTRRWSVGLCWN